MSNMQIKRQEIISQSDGSEDADATAAEAAVKCVPLADRNGMSSNSPLQHCARSFIRLEKLTPMPNPIRKAKAWTSKQVADILGDGVHAAVENLTSARDDSKVIDVAFVCGCRVDDLAGQWNACEKSLHQILASEPFHSDQARKYLKARALFHTVLQEAWVRNGPSWLSRRQEIREVHHVMPEMFYLNHDLTDRWIMNDDGELEAQLETLPHRRVLHLYNGGSAHRPNFILQIMIDRAPEPIWLELQDLDTEKATAKSFSFVEPVEDN